MDAAAMEDEAAPLAPATTTVRKTRVSARVFDSFGNLWRGQAGWVRIHGSAHRAPVLSVFIALLCDP